jgi:uncharacterized phage protein gp47/JayE
VPSQSDVASSIVAALAVTEPILDTSVGSMVRKIIDAIASSISDITVDNQILSYQYDVTSMTGANLDAFVQLFGLARFPAARATGTVTFAITTPNTNDISIPVNAQVSNSDASVVAQTLTAATLAAGALTVTVPVQVTTAGAAGNVAAGTLTVLTTPVTGIATVTNVGPTTGGSAQETDSQLQARWSATVFRNMAGTSSMYLGIALAAPGCTGANVIGGYKRRTEQLQIVSGAATSTVPDAAFVYASGQVAGNDISNGDIAVPGLQYTWGSGSIPPVVTAIDTSYFPNGDIFDLTFAYTPVWSRNQPGSNITNRIDVWCAGVNAVAAAQSLIFSNSRVFSASSAAPFYTGKYVRPDGTAPAAGNYFIPLAWGPIVTLPSTIVIGATTYGLATPANPLGTVAGGITYAYQIVHESDAFGWGPYSNFGMEWLSTAAPANNTAFSITEDYTYNNVPAVVQADIESWALAGTDALAHQAIEVPLQFSIAVLYEPSVTRSVTNEAIDTAISTYLSQLGFNAIVYPSSIIQAVENTAGVIASRFIVGSDISGYNGALPNNYDVGIQQLNPTGTTVTQSFVDTGGNPKDVILGDAQVPTFGNVVITPKALNSFGSFA